MNTKKSGKSSRENMFVVLTALKELTNEDKGINITELTAKIKEVYKKELDRDTVSAQLSELLIHQESLGITIEYDEIVQNGKKNANKVIKNNYRYIHEFKDEELDLLIDSITFNRYIPQDKKKEIIKKLAQQADKAFQNNHSKFNGVLDISLGNEKILETYKILKSAIRNGHKVQFNYSIYGLDRQNYIENQLYKNKSDISQDRVYTVSPYYIVNYNGRIYLICNMANTNEFHHYRLDRIQNIKELNEKRRIIDDIDGGIQFDPMEYIMESLYMFSGKSTTVKFEIDQKNYAFLDDIVDWFGKDIKVRKSNDKLIIRVKTKLAAMKIWALQYSKIIKVIEPVELVNDIKEEILELNKKYNEEEN